MLARAPAGPPQVEGLSLRAGGRSGLSLRVDAVAVRNPQLQSLFVEATGSAGSYLLRHLDARHAGELLELRGALDTTGPQPQLSLAGRGSRFPLGALLSDLGVQSGASGDLLAWLAAGAGAGKVSTRFDCSMAQFDFGNGVARSDSLYRETPRRLATGDAAIDSAQGTVDIRLQPRSRQRSLQFPSAVRIRGALSDPEIRVSPLQ